jgi:DNA-binding XRE family transcriptional regulator
LGLDPECKWREAHLAQKLGVIQQTINSWISDIRARQRANRNIIIIRLSRLACPPSFWRGWLQEQIAETTGVTRGRVAQIVNNANFGEINNLLSQGRDIDYIDLLKRAGWEITHIIDCPMSTQRFQANIVTQMQKNRTLGIVRRSLIIVRKK